MKEFIFTYVITTILVITAIVLSICSDIMKDSSCQTEKPYSLAKTQTMWWTVIILCSFSASFGMYDEMQEINSSSLILLGISLGTVASAKIIDNNDMDKKVRRHQDWKSKSFFIDILSDENGVSVHRFQALVFNLIFGVIYIVEFIENGTYAEFGELELTLMGISAATFVSLKAVENKDVAEDISNNQSSVTDSDEDLADIDESYSIELTNPEN